MSNPYAGLLALLPSTPLQVGTVLDTAAGVSTIELPGGGTITARGSATIGAKVFVRAGLIEGEAPSLTLVAIDV